MALASSTQLEPKRGRVRLSRFVERLGLRFWHSIATHNDKRDCHEILGVGVRETLKTSALPARVRSPAIFRRASD
jgi:hypothetical protein